MKLPVELESKHVEKFEKSVLELLEIEFENIRDALDSDEMLHPNFKHYRESLWKRHDDIFYMMSIISRRYEKSEELHDGVMCTKLTMLDI